MSFKKVMKYAAIGFATIYVGAAVEFRGRLWIHNMRLEHKLHEEVCDTQRYVPDAINAIKQLGTRGKGCWDIKVKNLNVHLTKNNLEIKIPFMKKMNDGYLPCLVTMDDKNVDGSIENSRVKYPVSVMINGKEITGTVESEFSDLEERIMMQEIYREVMKILPEVETEVEKETTPSDII